MKARWVLALLASATVAGCTAGETTNPNLIAPKLVLEARADGSVTIFLHAAFGEHVYDRLTLQADNATVAERNSVFSLEETIPIGGFYFEALAAVSRDSYQLRGRVDVDLHEDEARVALLDEDGSWNDAHTYRLPFERVLARRSTS